MLLEYTNRTITRMTRTNRKRYSLEKQRGTTHRERGRQTHWKGQIKLAELARLCLSISLQPLQRMWRGRVTTHRTQTRTQTVWAKSALFVLLCPRQPQPSTYAQAERVCVCVQSDRMLYGQRGGKGQRQAHGQTTRKVDRCPSELWKKSTNKRVRDRHKSRMLTFQACVHVQPPPHKRQ